MKLRIGTRKSPLAMWQAYKAQEALEKEGYDTEIVPISSEGDLQLSQPIYELGITGVFTKTLDIALVNNQIDLAVHSLKDVPTQLANGLHLSACLSRGDHRDILVYKSEDILEKEKRTIATGSLRRKAFWLHQFPQDQLVDLRGNVQLRIRKLLENEAWDGAVFAYAGLDRSEILEKLEQDNLKFKVLNQMVSAPSQGIVGIVCREDLDLSCINHSDSYFAALAERTFLRVLEGGCTAPIGAFAEIKENKIHLKGSVLSLEGKQKIDVQGIDLVENAAFLGERLAIECREKGGEELVASFRKA